MHLSGDHRRFYDSSRPAPRSGGDGLRSPTDFRLGWTVATPTAAIPVATRDQQRPVVAIGSDGDVTRVNAPARELLQADFASGHLSLGALVALLLQRDPSSRGIVSFSLERDSEEPPSTALSVVLSIQESFSIPREEGVSDRTSFSRHRGLHSPDDCAVCRLRSPLETIQRVARGLRRDTSVQRKLDIARELELLEVEAQRASFIVENSLELQPMAAGPGSRLNDRDRGPITRGGADTDTASKYGLTHREVDVLQHIVQGQTDRGIARSLNISTYTVNKHVANILSKMAASSRTAAGVRAIREGIVG